MSLILYQTSLKPEHNARYENLESYLDTCSYATFPEFQYIKPLLTTDIKLPMDGYSKNSPYNYVKIVQKGVTYYYFITAHKWISENTLGVTLVLDTINTFWDDLTSKITANTHITRCFKDRYVKRNIAGVNTLVPKVDKYAEDIDSPTLVRNDVAQVGDSHLWYLISKTDSLASDTKLAANPVTNYLLKDESMTSKGTTVLTITPELISADACAYVIPISGEESIITCIIDGTPRTFYFSNSREYDFCYWFYHEGTIQLKIHQTGKYDGTTGIADTYKNVDSIVLLNVRTVYKQSDSWDTYFSNAGVMNAVYTVDSPIVYNSIQGGTKIPSFNTWYNNNKTDSTLIKIVCLPYQPFDLEEYQEGIDYIGTPSGFKLLNPNIVFSYDITDTLMTYSTYADTVIKTDPSARGVNYNLKYETKQYNSQYYQVKYVYDSSSLSYDLETFSTKTVQPTSISMDIQFCYNKELSNSLAFKFTIPSELTYEYDSDFGNWLIVDKTLDVPFFTNEYLNYLRYGKAVDQRNAGWSTLAAAIGGASTTVNSVASLKAIGQGNVSWIGKALGGVGVVSTVISVGSTIAKSRDAINLKMDTYRHQASDVNGSSDISIFTKYGKNKLLRITYGLPNYLHDQILNYFRIYGYTTDRYAIPSTNTRYWSDFIQAEIDLEANNVDTDYVDDFKERYASGLRIYHWHDMYDFNFTYENWEVSLIG